jgi:hypothetical protein
MTMPSNDSDINVTTDQVLELAGQLSNDGSQPSQQGQEQGQDQRIPYDRFKEVNDERKSLQEQNSKLMEMMQQFQAMQQTNQTQQVPSQQAAQPPQTTLFTDEELNSFEQDIIVDPKATLQKFGEAILNRGVENRVKSLEATFEQKLQQLTGQLTATTLPTVIANFKQSRFGPNQGAEIAAFDEALKTLDPSLLSNTATLENVRLAAIGYVADKRSSGQQPAIPFSESPGGGPTGGWGGLGGQQQAPQIPSQVIEAARKMGVDPREAAAMYQAMNTSGVFRG